MRKKSLIAVMTLALLWGVCPLLFCSSGNSFYDEDQEHHFEPEDGMVPDEETAVAIAEAVWLPVYGEDIYNHEPFQAVLHDGLWQVEGSLPKDRKGGVPEAEIRKSDGKIVRLSHSQ